MSGSQPLTEMLTSLNSGMLDEFGTGTVVNGKGANFTLPTIFAAMAQHGWSVAQWGQPQAVNVNNYIVNSPLSYDDLYGDALYLWSEPGQTSAIALYQNASGGDVVQLTDGSTNTAPQGQTDEADMFLTAPTPSSAYTNLSHPVTLSLSAKVLQSITDFASSTDAAKYATGSPVFSVMDIGFYIQYNGANGIPSYGGFVQIVPWSSITNSNVAYESDQETPGQSTSPFISSIRLGTGGALTSLTSDADALPDTLTYNINQYAYAAILAHFSQFSAAQRASLDNLANWTVSAPYFGIATDNVPTALTSSGTVASDVAYISSTLQVSNITLTTNLNQTYTPTTAANATASTTVDSNPQITYKDNTMWTSGTADGGVYVGLLTNIQYEYIYTGYDNINLTAPTNGNWYFGGGYGPTTLTATSGNNDLVSSMAGSVMNGGTGDDSFIIQKANSNSFSSQNTIKNFHAGDQVILNGLNNAGWTYQWLSNGSSSSPGTTLLATNESLGLTESVTLPDVTSANMNQISLTKVASSDNISIGFDSTSSTSTANLATTALTFPSEMTQLSFVHSGSASTPQTQQLSAPARLSGAGYAEVENFSSGDSLVVNNLTGLDWSYSLSSFSNSGLELVLENNLTGTSESIIFGGTNDTDPSSLAISWGAATSNHLLITHL